MISEAAIESKSGIETHELHLQIIGIWNSMGIAFGICFVTNELDMLNGIALIFVVLAFSQVRNWLEE